MGDEKPQTDLDEVRSGLDLAAAELGKLRHHIEGEDLEAADGSAGELGLYCEAILGNIRRERERRGRALHKAAPRMLELLRDVASEPGRERERLKEKLDDVIREAEGRAR